MPRGFLKYSALAAPQEGHSTCKGPPMTDRELLDAFIQTGRECATAREAAFSELVRRYWRMVYATAHRILDDWQLTEDVAQSVFLLLARKAPTLATRSVLSGWLY